MCYHTRHNSQSKLPGTQASLSHLVNLRSRGAASSSQYLLNELCERGPLRQVLDIDGWLGAFEACTFLALSPSATRRPRIVVIVKAPQRSGHLRRPPVSIAFIQTRLRCRTSRGRHGRVLLAVKVLCIVAIEFWHGHVIASELGIVVEVFALVITILHRALTGWWHFTSWCRLLRASLHSR